MCVGVDVCVCVCVCVCVGVQPLIHVSASEQWRWSHCGTLTSAITLDAATWWGASAGHAATTVKTLLDKRTDADLKPPPKKCYFFLWPIILW